MSWLYLQGPEGESLRADSLDGTPYVPSKLMNTVNKSYSNGKETESLVSFQFGMTLEPSTESRGEGSSTLSLADSHAKTFQQLIRQVKDWPVVARVFGSSICESLVKFGLALSMRKTHPHCVSVDSAQSSKDLPTWGMTHDGECWGLGISVQFINEPECGWWPTLTVQDAKNNGGPSQHRRNTKPVNALVNGPVNPEWAEWYMGWPVGWTDLRPLEMDSFQSWLRQHGTYSLAT